jgi:hypothetical protein
VSPWLVCFLFWLAAGGCRSRFFGEAEGLLSHTHTQVHWRLFTHAASQSGQGVLFLASARGHVDYCRREKKIFFFFNYLSLFLRE